VRNPNASYGAGVDDPLDAGGMRRLQQIVGAIHVALVQVPRILGPETVVGRDVEDESTASYCTLHGGGIAKIAGHYLHIEAGDTASGTYECANLVATLAEYPGDVPAEEA
jgi:hypothetical protein